VADDGCKGLGLKNYRLGFVMEQTLGHVTHDRNLRQWVAEDLSVAPEWMPVAFEADDRWQRAPLVRGNWTLRASLRAKGLVRETLKRQPLDGLFFHTQVTALFAPAIMRRIPTVVSLDATPLNVDSVGEAYDHRPSGNRQMEALKNALNRRTFRTAGHLITWCDWAKQSLVRDYGVFAEKVTVIPPGIDLSRWTFDRSARRENGKVRLLFVGGDFRRKGGEFLLEAFRKELAGFCELDIVTREQVDTEGLEGVRVHHGLNSNAPELLSLYAAADIFVFPTLGDCLPIAVMEAMAAGIPVVATCVGALSEEVDDGVTGCMIPPENCDALAATVSSLAKDEDRRRAMGLAGRKQAEAKFSGQRNYNEVIAVVKRCVDGS
jgi:glycosyltransferase involved in cell wall biosynthesis